MFTLFGSTYKDGFNLEGQFINLAHSYGNFVKKQELTVEVQCNFEMEH